MTHLDPTPPPSSAGFTRTLALTPQEDLLGYLRSLGGRVLLFAVTAFSVLAVMLIFAFIMLESYPFLVKYPFAETLGSTEWYPTYDPPDFGMWPLIYGSLLVTLGALLIAAPLGLLTAMFLSDIVSFKVRQIVKPIVEILAAIPSVAIGFFAILVLAPILQTHLGMSTGANALNASIMLALMALPTIISVAEDSLMAVGRETREASYALGATRAETLLRTVVPAASNGIMAALILGIMRAIGETMVVWMASGNAAQIPEPWWDLTAPVRTMTATIAGEMGEAPEGSDHRNGLFVVGLLLLSFTFVLNLMTEFLLRRFQRISSGAKT